MWAAQLTQGNLYALLSRVLGTNISVLTLLWEEGGGHHSIQMSPILYNFSNIGDSIPGRQVKENNLKPSLLSFYDLPLAFSDV